MNSHGGREKDIGDAALLQWEAFAVRLAPIIGNGGFRALYARSLHLTQVDFPWLAVPPNGETAGPEALLLSLATDLRAHPPELAKQAHQALTRTFTGLLDSLIGPALTAQLLQSAQAQSGLNRSQESNDDR